MVSADVSQDDVEGTKLGDLSRLTLPFELSGHAP